MGLQDFLRNWGLGSAEEADNGLLARITRIFRNPVSGNHDEARFLICQIAPIRIRVIRVLIRCQSVVNPLSIRCQSVVRLGG